MSRTKTKKSIVENVEVVENKDVDNVVDEEPTFDPFNTHGIVSIGGIYSRLNVRKESSLKSDVIIVLDNGTELDVDLEGSTKDFYRIRLDNGLIGFCIRKAIKVV